MSLVKLATRQKVAIVTFEGAGEVVRHPWGSLLSEHRFNKLFLKDLALAVNQIETQLPSLRGVVFTGQGRFFSNGFDLDFFKTVSHAEALELQINWERLIARILKLPLITVAALNGHTAAAGALFSLAFDYRLMNSEHGIFYVPAAKLGLTFSPGLIELCGARLTPQTFREAVLLCKKFPASEAHAAGIVDQLIPGHQLIDAAIKFCEAHALPQSQFKAKVNRQIIDAFETATPEQRDMGWAPFTSKL